MLNNKSQENWFASAFTILELIFHSAIRSVRKGHGNAVIGLLMNIAQTMLLVAVFYTMYLFMGFSSGGIRGDFMLYLMTGVFLFMCHVKAMGAVVGSEGPTSAMMKHAPMNTIVAIGAAALGELYVQVLSVLVVLFIYHAAWQPLVIHDLLGTIFMLLLAWFSGAAIGVLLLAAKPWAPQAIALVTQIYSRANMFASGKMFVANSLPGFMIPYFDWNPLFHTIDQARGFAFLNYNPHYSSVIYPVVVSLVLLLIGLMGEFYTRRRASLSWGARH
ncbi:ABC transporter permease [Pararhodobacter oceanensis]|uniref:ABC transporter permease n=1 Tax=Pararhodobacter oceanensis TaxID=2172121 RepID=A0A2T8HSP1_9RHOB|nr:ABC transporter permease [Pararhodobacter oceanensis]PVH28322.1 ABC transporter permease [Pararhodobacter oceanensis]